MSRAALALIAALAIAAVPAGEAATGTAHGIPWSPDRPLSWDDFRGTPPPGRPREAAEIVYELMVRYRVAAEPRAGAYVARLAAEVTLLMRPDLSWVLPRGRTPALLAHEQGHFDLAEVYRRLLVASLAGLKASGSTPAEAMAALRRRADSIVLAIRERMGRAQTRYDADTDHGRDPLAQAAWKKRIAGWLADPRSAP